MGRRLRAAPAIILGASPANRKPAPPVTATLVRMAGTRRTAGRRALGRLVLLSGFGPFERVRENPSGAIVRALAARPPRGVEIAPAILPVSFARAPRALDRALAALEPRVPDLFLGLGVMREPGYRLELRARPSSRGRTRVDVDGRASCDIEGAGGGALFTPLAAWLAAYVRAHKRLRVSEYAGGYVCERVYHHLLFRAEARERPALFLHVPPERHASVEQGIEVVGRLLADLAPDL
jgi:pyroglutamyl-peptidase